jgi:hypothetical protein
VTSPNYTQTTDLRKCHPHLIQNLDSAACYIKGQCHEIFDTRFFHKSTPYRTLIHGLQPFRTWLRIRRDFRFGSRLIFIELPVIICAF